MAGLLDILNSDLGKKLISGASAETGAPESKTADVLSMAICLWSCRTNIYCPRTYFFNTGGEVGLLLQ